MSELLGQAVSLSTGLWKLICLLCWGLVAIALTWVCVLATPLFSHTSVRGNLGAA
jgi:hypothetical protein